MKRAFIVLLLLFCSPFTCESWTSKTYQIVVVNSVKLMPGSFRRIMLRHKEEILSGCLKPDGRGEEAHSYDHLVQRVLELTSSIPEKINNHKPFREIAVDFGSLSHYMSDLNDPLLLADTDSREQQYRMDFPIYLEKQTELFPWVFDGHEDTLLKNDRLSEYLAGIAANTVEKYPRLGESYFPNGALVSSDTFDPKSLPFGIASLSYSRSIQHTVQIWFYTWKKAHGDLTNTPFYSKSKKKK